MKTITATVTAWLTQHYTPKDLDCAPERAVEVLVYSPQEMTSCGWSRAGTATITVELSDDLIDNKLEALREELKMARAEAQMKQQRIEQQISNLLALEYSEVSE